MFHIFFSLNKHNNSKQLNIAHDVRVYVTFNFKVMWLRINTPTFNFFKVFFCNFCMSFPSSSLTHCAEFLQRNCFITNFFNYSILSFCFEKRSFMMLLWFSFEILHLIACRIFSLCIIIRFLVRQKNVNAVFIIIVISTNRTCLIVWIES